MRRAPARTEFHVCESDLSRPQDRLLARARTRGAAKAMVDRLNREALAARPGERASRVPLLYVLRREAKKGVGR